MTNDTPTTLYRLFDAAGDLLYVGISTRPMQRVREHSKGQTWWTEVASQTFEHFPTRPEAATAELAAIRTENPRYNVAGAKVSPMQAQRERSWKRLLTLKPSCADLVTLATIIGRSDRSPTFCANAYWYGYDMWNRSDPESPIRIPQVGLRDLLNVMVGCAVERRVAHLPPADQHFLAGWGGAHDLLYDRAYEALPDCRHLDYKNGACHSHRGRLDYYEILDLPGVGDLDLPWGRALRETA